MDVICRFNGCLFMSFVIALLCKYHDRLSLAHPDPPPPSLAHQHTPRLAMTLRTDALLCLYLSRQNICFFFSPCQSSLTCPLLFFHSMRRSHFSDPQSAALHYRNVPAAEKADRGLLAYHTLLFSSRIVAHMQTLLIQAKRHSPLSP